MYWRAFLSFKVLGDLHVLQLVWLRAGRQRSLNALQASWPVPCTACVSLGPVRKYSFSGLFLFMVRTWVMHSEQCLQLLGPFSCPMSRKRSCLQEISHFPFFCPYWTTLSMEQWGLQSETWNKHFFFLVGGVGLFTFKLWDMRLSVRFEIKLILCFHYYTWSKIQMDSLPFYC